MLVLSRTRDETIMIGDEVEITVVDIRGEKVRLGVTAPTSIPVHRKEVYEAIKRENHEASQLKPEEVPQSGHSSEQHISESQTRVPKRPGTTGQDETPRRGAARSNRSRARQSGRIAHE